ncbi:MAG: methionyl-tRNA formyltransferase [Alphaproteobacteria bacterium]|nr:methionyl-tRNA formyltransferase [Alphaproteobacteria bacterium]
MAALRLVFMGTPEIAVPALSALWNDGHEVVCAYSQPPRPSGRGHRVTPSPVHNFAEDHGIPVRTPENFKSAETVSNFADLNADLAVVMAYGLILPATILEAPRLGCINIHVSLLPCWRGAAPIQRAIMAGDDETGVTIMQMDEGLDTGPILRQDRVPIGQETTAESLHDRLAQLGAASICDALVDLQAGDVDPMPQSDVGATYAAKITRDEGLLDWRQSAIDVERRIRALNPWPGTWFERNGERIRILSAELVNGAGEPGTILDECAVIACGDGAIKPLVMQRPGKSATDAEAFLRGYDLPVGTVLALPQTGDR